MAGESAGRIEVEAVEKPGMKLVLEGLDLNELDEETRREVEHLLVDFAELLRDGVVHGDLSDVREGLNTAEIAMRDRVFEERRDGSQS